MVHRQDHIHLLESLRPAADSRLVGTLVRRRGWPLVRHPLVVADTGVAYRVALAYRAVAGSLPLARGPPLVEADIGVVVAVELPEEPEGKRLDRSPSEAGVGQLALVLASVQAWCRIERGLELRLAVPE